MRNWFKGGPARFCCPGERDDDEPRFGPQQLNAYIRQVTGGRFTAKDFRTLSGTILAAESLARTGTKSTARERAKAERAAIEACAEGLGNTPAVAKSSYIDPRVFKQYRRGHLLDTSRTPESAIRSLLLC